MTKIRVGTIYLENGELRFEIDANVAAPQSVVSVPAATPAPVVKKTPVERYRDEWLKRSLERARDEFKNCVPALEQVLDFLDTIHEADVEFVEENSNRGFMISMARILQFTNDPQVVFKLSNAFHSLSSLKIRGIWIPWVELGVDEIMVRYALYYFRDDIRKEFHLAKKPAPKRAREEPEPEPEKRPSTSMLRLPDKPSNPPASPAPVAPAPVAAPAPVTPAPVVSAPAPNFSKPVSTPAAPARSSSPDMDREAFEKYFKPHSASLLRLLRVFLAQKAILGRQDDYCVLNRSHFQPETPEFALMVRVFSFRGNKKHALMSVTTNYYGIHKKLFADAEKIIRDLETVKK